MKKYNTTLWVQNLEAIYEQALTAKPVKPFFITIYDYVNYIITTDTLAQLSDVFFVHKKVDYEIIEQYKKELIDGIEQLLPKLEKYETDSVTDKESIKDALAIRKGTIQVLDDPEGWISIFGHIESMAYDSIQENGVNEATLKLLGVEEFNNNNIKKWPLADVYNGYKQELDKMERIRETRGWWCWEHLKLFYEIFSDFEGIKAEIVENRRWFQSMKMSYLKEELQAILKNTTYDQMRTFIYEDYVTYLHKVHRELINEIAEFEEVSKMNEPQVSPSKITIPFHFDGKSDKLLINEKQIAFKKDTRKLALLKLLMKNTKGVYYAEAVEQLEGAVTDKAFNPKNTYYETCRGIEMSLSKVGITDFLIFDYSQAKINPIYKKSSE